MSQESAHHWIPISTNEVVMRGSRICFLILCFLGASCYRTSGQDASSLANDLAWSIAHEGCDLYVGNSQRSLSELRACFVRSQHDSPETANKIRACSSNVLTEAIRSAIELSFSKYQIEQNFEWVVVHEGQLQSFRDLAADGKFSVIRKRYYALQEHNFDARNNLSAVSDKQIVSMLMGTRISVVIKNDAELSRLAEFADLVPSRNTKVDRQTTFGEFVQAQYGSAPPNLMKLIQQKNPGLSEKASPNQSVGEIVLGIGDVVTLPSFPRIGRITAVRISPDKNPDTIQFLAASLSTVGDQGVIAQLDVSGEIEEPVLTSTRPSSGQTAQPIDDGWYLKKIGLQSMSKSDLALIADSVVGIVDGGADLQNSLLAGHFWKIPSAQADDEWLQNDAGYDFYHQRPRPLDEMDNSHGTHVSGLIVGIRSSQRLPEVRAAIGSRIKLAELKITGQKPQFSMTTAENCVRVSFEKNIELFNVSFRSEYSLGLQTYISQTTVINKSLFVVAAGNDSASLDDDPKKHKTFRDPNPDHGHKSLKNVIFVAALGRDGEHVARFSNYGGKTVQIAAPGVDIASTVRSGRLQTLSGTSQAAPFVTMTAAILHSEMPSNFSWQEIKQRILDTCDWVPTLEDYVKDGCRLNVLKATLVKTDLVELKDGTILKGTISKDETSFPTTLPGSPGWKDQLERIWIKDSKELGKNGNAVYVATTGRNEGDTKDTDAVRIDTNKAYPCPAATLVNSDQHKCLIRFSMVRDIVFRVAQP
jgi:subtilisin family serine protease